MKLAKVIFLLTGLALFVAAPAEAQVRKTIRFVVPVAAGGSYDLMARIIADKLTQIYERLVSRIVLEKGEDEITALLTAIGMLLALASAGLSVVWSYRPA